MDRLIVIGFAVLASLNACSDSSSQGREILAVYDTRLSPINREAHDFTDGAAAFAEGRDHLTAQLTEGGLIPERNYRAGVFSGARCPESEADSNQDGWVDIVEARAVIGDGLIPFDGDLDSQAAGSETLLVADSRGVVDYQDEADLSALLLDLRVDDTNPDDLLGKLGPGVELELGDRTVVVLGAPLIISLPPTVASVPGLSQHDSLPIACGELVQRTIFD